MYSLEEINTCQRSLPLQRCPSFLCMLVAIWALMCLCVYLRDLWECWAYAVDVLYMLCIDECRHMYIVWGTCEPVCPLSAYVIV